MSLILNLIGVLISFLIYRYFNICLNDYAKSLTLFIIGILFSVSSGFLNVIPLKIYCKLGNGNIKAINF